jgi:hypothetical protein
MSILIIQLPTRARLGTDPVNGEGVLRHQDPRSSAMC